MKAILLRLLFWIICIHLPFKANAQLQDSLDWIYAKLPTQIFPTGLLHDASSVHLFTHESPLDPHFHNGAFPAEVPTSSVYSMSIWICIIVNYEIQPMCYVRKTVYVFYLGTL